MRPWGVLQAGLCRMAPGLETGKAMMDRGGARRLRGGRMCLWALVSPRIPLLTSRGSSGPVTHAFCAAVDEKKNPKENPVPIVTQL